MAIYNFKKETRLYIVRNNTRYYIDIYPDLSFSQTFNETSVPVKTLHTQYNMFENAVITKANPANFNFTIPILYETDMDIVLDLLMDYDLGQPEATLKTADLYFVSSGDTFKIEKCAFESGTFQIQRNSVVTLNISGSGKKLTRLTVGNVPGEAAVRANTRTFTPVTSMLVKVKGEEQTSLTGVTLEVKNDVTWIDFATLQNSLSVSNASDTQYPEAFVVGSRTLSGTIQQYITDNTRTNLQGWATAAPLTVEVGDASKQKILKVAIPAAVYTNRLEVQDLYIQSYDFRMVSNPTSLKDVFVKGVS